MASLHDITTVQLKQALHLKEQIESLQGKLDALLGGPSSPTAKKKVGHPKGKRTISPEHRAALAAAQQARWAKIHGKAAAKKAVPAKAPPVKMVAKKKVMSPESKAKIAAAMKARWEAKKKGATTAADKNE